MGVYVDKIVGFIADVTDEANVEDIAYCEEELSQTLKDLGFHRYHSTKSPGEDSVTLIYDGMNGRYAKLVFIKSADYYSDDNSEPNEYVNAALKTLEVPIEIREQMQKVYSCLFNSDKPIEVYLQEFAHWH